MTLHFDQNRLGPLVPGDMCQLGGAEVVRSCLWGLGLGGGWSQRAPSRQTVRAECPSHAHGAVLLSLRSADLGSCVQRGSQAKARGRGTSGSGGHGNVPG